MNTDEKMLPKGCGYTGYDFGASYKDSQCFGGQLYDLDHCDGDGLLFEPMEYKPCPECRHDEWLKSILEDMEEQGALAAMDGLVRAFPIEETKLRYPGDHEAMKTAWLRGYDSFETESV